MKFQNFIEEFKKLIETEEELDKDTTLDNIEEWDSLNIMNTVIFLEKTFNKKFKFSELAQCKTVMDLYNLGGKNEN